MSNKNGSFYFFKGGGEMGELIRAKDWSKTSLGNPENWAQSLRTTLGILLNSKFPMFLWWGPELICFYNDAYRPSLGKEGKHPSILGMPAKEAWTEIWEIIKPLIDKVVNEGESIWFEDMLIPIYRNGKIEDVYWTFSYSPVTDETENVAGVLVTCVETTEKVYALKKIEERDQRFRNTMKQAPVGITILRGPQYMVEMANDSYLQLVDKKESEFVGNPLFDSLPEVKDTVHSLLDTVINTGIPYHGNEVLVPINRYGNQDLCYFDFLYHPLKEDDGTISGVMVAVTEVTEKVEGRKKVEERKRLYESVTQNTPDLVYVFDLNYRFVYANEALLKMWGRSWEDAEGKKLLEVGYEPWHAQMHEREIDLVIANKKPVRGEVSFPHATLGNRVYDYIFVPVIDKDGKVEAISGITRDITQQVESHKQIEESDNKLRSLIENAPFPIGVFSGKEMRIELANESIIKAWGKGYDVKGRLFKELLPEVENQQIFEQLDEVFSTGLPLHAHNKYLNILIDGKEQPYYYNYSFTPVFDSSGNVYGVMNTASDVTDLNLAKKKIEESEQDLRSMVLQAPIGICILDAATLVCEIVNDCFIQISGKSKEAILGKNYWSMFTEEMPYFDADLKKVVTEGKPFFSNETEYIQKLQGGDERIFVTFVYAPLKDEEGQVKKVAVWVMDNTKQVLSRRKIEEDTEKLNIVIDASELGTWELNLKTKEPTYSKRYLEIVGGYKKDVQLTHAELLKHLHPDDFPIREKAFKVALATGYLHYQARLIWKDNSIHWMEGKGKVFYDEENKPVKLMGTIRDITEEKNHEEELKKSEEQFSTLADNMENLAWLADGDGWIYWYNKRWLEYTGLSLEEMQGWGWQKVHHPDHVERIVESSKKIWNINETFELTFPLRRHDGEYRWFLTRGYPVTNEEGKIIRWIGTNTDINEQKKAEEQFKILADQAPMWVWLTDKEVNILYTNPEILKFFSIAHYSEFTGQLWEKVVYPDDVTMVYNTFAQAALLQQSFSFEFRVLNANTNQYEWFYLKAVPRMEADEFTGFIGTGININDQKTFAKELEEKVITRTAELKASEEKFYNLFNLSPISKTLSDISSGKIVMVNDAFTKLFGYNRNMAVGKSSAELGLLDPEARDFMISELRANGKIENKEINFIKKSGERFVALASSEVISLGDKQFFLSAFNDISEIKKAEQYIKQKNIELENKTIQLEEAQQLAHIGSWEWDVVANNIEWSDELFRIFGLTPQVIKADYENYLRYIHPDDREYVNSIIQSALKNHQPYSFFHKVACADGKVRILSATGKVITDGAGKVIKISGTAQDVTDQKKYEEELKISEERFYKIFDSNPVPMSLSDINTSKIKYANNRFYTAFGYSKEEVIGRSSEELGLLDPEESKRVVNLIFGYLLEDRTLAEVQALSKEEKELLLLKLKQSEKMKDFEILYTRKNGEKFPALVSYEVIRIGVDSYTVASYQDITERKKAEALLRSQNFQLEKMNKELQSFAYISSHDLQEPLRKIQTFASRIKEKEEYNLTDSGKDMFSRMQEAAKRMQTLIQDLLAYSRNNTTEQKTEIINLNEIITDVKEDLQQELLDKNATIEAEHLSDVSIIPFQFRQLMQNLISNSLKFSKPENPPHIIIRSEIGTGLEFNIDKLTPDKNYCHISVSDNGIGFEQHYSEKIFEVFQRLHSKNEYNGTGIGLSIVKKIVDNHNGIIIAKGEPNKGATFDIYIPATN